VFLPEVPAMDVEFISDTHRLFAIIITRLGVAQQATVLHISALREKAKIRLEKLLAAGL
jgi:hypothetical protein